MYNDLAIFALKKKAQAVDVNNLTEEQMNAIFQLEMKEPSTCKAMTAATKQHTASTLTQFLTSINQLWGQRIRNTSYSCIAQEGPNLEVW
jgi:hypothetical protein